MISQSLPTPSLITPLPLILLPFTSIRHSSQSTVIVQPPKLIDTFRPYPTKTTLAFLHKSPCPMTQPLFYFSITHHLYCGFSFLYIILCRCFPCLCPSSLLSLSANITMFLKLYFHSKSLLRRERESTPGKYSRLPANKSDKHH